MLRAAVRVTAARIDGASIEVRISPRGLGHAFPTGDLFRRVEILAEALGPDAQVLAEDARYLARRFGEGRGVGDHTVKVLVSDDRVMPAGDTVVKLSPGPEARGRPIAWRVAYQRVEHPIEDGSDEAIVGGEVVIAEGVLAPP
jgi:hypothetical protein